MLFNSKKCPRCGTKLDKQAMVCPSCGLNYIKFNEATNKEAKQAMIEGEKDRVLLRTGCPNDIKRWKLILMCIFLGYAGGHHYYVGRKYWGLFYSCFFLVGVINAFVTVLFPEVVNTDAFQIFYLLVLIWGIVIVMWIIDLVKICLNKYKIPVSRT